MNFDDCLKNGFIKKDSTAPERVNKSLEIAIRFLISSKKNLDIDELEMAELASYNTIFHAARALLFKKEYTERSHTCLITALKALYIQNQPLLNLLNTFDKIRISRHNIQYGGILIDKDEAEFVLEFATSFLDHVQEIIHPPK